MQNIFSLLEGKNIRVFLMRHGPSLANKHGLIVSSLETDDKIDAGLDPCRLDELKSRVATQLKDLQIATKPIVIASPFRRTLQTAEIVCALTETKKYLISDDLRERYFGAFDGTSDQNYETVWQAESDLAHLKNLRIESTAEVFTRLFKFIQTTSAQTEQSRDIILVSHGDPINILRTCCYNLLPENHRSANFHQINTGEILKFNLAATIPQEEVF